MPCTWRAGAARVEITPEGPMWLAGYGSRRLSEGARHPLWVKALGLEDAAGRRAVLLTSDLVGFSHKNCSRLREAAQERFGLGKEALLLTYSHSHCSPVTSEVLPDYYPLEEADWQRVAGYTRWLESRILDVMAEALAAMAPASLSFGSGEATFAVNRRNNREAVAAELLANGIPLQGPVDHSVPVLTVQGADGALQAVVFGYACHPTTLSDLQWCGDYPGYAQAELEQRHPGAVALFWTGCGGDQNPLPRRSVELCEEYGQRLAEAVEAALQQPMTPVASRLRAAYEEIRLDFDRLVTPEELGADAASANGVRARWARRMLALRRDGQSLPTGCDYGVQAWRLGEELLWIALGGEAVVDYSLRFKREFGAKTWVCGYAHEMVGYVPSRRVWQEGGYEAEFIYEYGWPAYRWTEDTEERVAAAARRLAGQVTRRSGV